MAEADWLKVAAPQVLTACRIVFGAAAIICVPRSEFSLAATLITFGALTDIFDGLAARKLGTSSVFGALFDTFTDYLCFVVAPWFLTRAIVGAEGNVWLEVLIGIPLLTAAIRYARNSMIIASQADEVRELPGLATVFFAFLPVSAVFLDAKAAIGEANLMALLSLLVIVFSILMVTMVSYPKLSSYRPFTIPVVVLLVAMPFVGTRFLAFVMVVAGIAYVILGPMLKTRKPHRNE